MAFGDIFRVMESWEETLLGWTSLGLMKLARTAVAVPIWEYAALMVILTSTWLYYILDFHFVKDLLTGFKGEIPRLYYNPASRIAAQILPKCNLLKQRFCATPWLSSPHLQTVFLHFNGNTPPIKYHRQLYITPDEGTIALDWVKPPLGKDGEEIDNNGQSPELDETPLVIMVPGLTSDSDDAYLKHIAYSTALKGWRTVVMNHRGLGGVSITSDQFYNAGWTEDLRRIINYVHDKYPRAPLFAVGTSLGANIMVKYLGEEGAATPLGAAAAVCNPWDLVVCDRFMSRNGVQKLYTRALAIGLLQYASLHQTVLGRLADWDLISKSKSVRDFDNHCTRYTGSYETVDTYYRRCSSADFLANVAVPLLCFSSLDDPLCTKEAIPWDEIIANPNLVMVITKHGGHLAYFEGITARTIWWTRVLTEYMTLMIPSCLMNTLQKVPTHDLKKPSGSGVDKAPYLDISSSGQVAAMDLQPSISANTGQEANVDERDVIFEREGPTAKEETQDEHVFTSREIKVEQGSAGEGVVTLRFKDSTELAALQSALSQLLQQLQEPLITEDYKHENRADPANDDDHSIRPEIAMKEAVLDNDTHSSILAFREPPEIPVSKSVLTHLNNCREVALSLAESGRRYSRNTLKELTVGDESSKARISSNWSDTTKNKMRSTQQDRGIHRFEPRDPVVKGFAGVAAQNRRTLWLLTYIALVTTCPLIGSALYMRWRGKIADLTKRLFK